MPEGLEFTIMTKVEKWATSSGIAVPGGSSVGSQMISTYLTKTNEYLSKIESILQKSDFFKPITDILTEGFKNIANLLTRIPNILLGSRPGITTSTSPTSSTTSPILSPPSYSPGTIDTKLDFMSFVVKYQKEIGSTHRQAMDLLKKGGEKANLWSEYKDTGKLPWTKKSTVVPGTVPNVPEYEIPKEFIGAGYAGWSRTSPSWKVPEFKMPYDKTPNPYLNIAKTDREKYLAEGKIPSTIGRGSNIPTVLPYEDIPGTSYRPVNPYKERWLSGARQWETPEQRRGIDYNRSPTVLPYTEPDEDKKSPTRTLSLKELESATKRGFTPLSDLKSVWKEKGFSDKDIETKAALLTPKPKVPGKSEKDDDSTKDKSLDTLESISLKLLGLDTIAKWLRWIYEGFSSTGFGKAIDSMLDAIAKLFWLPIAEALYKLLMPILDVLLSMMEWWAGGGFERISENIGKGFGIFPILSKILPEIKLTWPSFEELKEGFKKGLKEGIDVIKEKLKLEIKWPEWIEKLKEKLRIRWPWEKGTEEGKVPGTEGTTTKVPGTEGTTTKVLGTVPEEVKSATAETEGVIPTKGGFWKSRWGIGAKGIIPGFLQAVGIEGGGRLLGASEETREKAWNISTPALAGTIFGAKGGLAGLATGIYGETGLPGSGAAKEVGGALGTAAMTSWLFQLITKKALPGPVGLAAGAADIVSENSITAPLAGPVGMGLNWYKTGTQPWSQEGQQKGWSQLSSIYDRLMNLIFPVASAGEFTPEEQSYFRGEKSNPAGLFGNTLSSNMLNLTASNVTIKTDKTEEPTPIYITNNVNMDGRTLFSIFDTKYATKDELGRALSTRGIS